VGSTRRFRRCSSCTYPQLPRVWTAVAYNKTDIVRRPEILIQARRYSKCVRANDLRALAGSRGGEVRNIRHPRYYRMGRAREQGLLPPATTGSELLKAANSNTC
jgi:hypothetical protein